MNELQGRVRSVKRKIFELAGDGLDVDGIDDNLSEFSDFSSLPSIQLEKIVWPDESSYISEEISEIPKTKSKTHVIDEQNSDIITIPQPPVNYAPVCGKPVRGKNILSPDLSKFKTATVFILKGRNFPKMKSGVHSTYVTFQFHPSLEVLSSPICFNHSREANYHCGYNIDISNINIDDAFPIIEVYDVISQKHGNLIGFTPIELQNCFLTNNYVTVLREQWVDIFVPHSRQRAGSVLISLFLHNGNLDYLPKETRNVVSFSIEPNNAKSESKSQNTQENSIDQFNETDKNNDNNENSLSSSQIPIKETKQTEKTTQSVKNYLIIDSDFVKHEKTQKETEYETKSTQNIPKETQKQIKLKSDFNFNLDNPELLNLLTFDVNHKHSWAKTKNMKRHIRYLDEDDIDLEYDFRKEEAETQTNITVREKAVQSRNENYISSGIDSDPQSSESYRPKDLMEHIQLADNSSDPIPMNLFHSSDKLAEYSDYGFFSRKSVK